MERTIKISEAAAASDISNIGHASEKLNDSLSSIKKLKNISAAMHGGTGDAITEQCIKLEKMISELQENLSSSQRIIRKVVNDYREEDARLKREIMMGGR